MSFFQKPADQYPQAFPENAAMEKYSMAVGQVRIKLL